MTASLLLALLTIVFMAVAIFTIYTLYKSFLESQLTTFRNEVIRYQERFLIITTSKRYGILTLQDELI